MNNGKIVVIGDSGVGKTTFMMKLNYNEFHQDIKSTIGSGVFELKLQGHKFIVWDTAGQERYRSLLPMYFRDAKAVMIVYDTNSENNNIMNWIKILEQNYINNVPIILIGTKTDLPLKQKIDDDFTNKIKKECVNFMGHITISSKNDDWDELENKLSNFVNKIIELNKKNILKTKDEIIDLNNNFIEKTYCCKY